VSQEIHLTHVTQAVAGLQTARPDSVRHRPEQMRNISHSIVKKVWVS